VTSDAEERPVATEFDRLIHEPARLMITAYLAVVERADMLFVQRQTGLTLGNLSSHVSKLEAAGYVAVEKTFVGKRPRTMLRLTERGRAALDDYRARMQSMLDTLPDETRGGA
jgi:DNA-binding MarR family transcriptional regulator